MKKIILTLFILTLLFGCTNKQEEKLDLPESTTGNDLIPHIDNFEEHEPETALQLVSDFSASTKFAAILGGPVPAGVLEGIGKTTKFVDCAHDVGAISSLAYIDPDHYWSLGVVAIADKNEVNTDNLLRCMIRTLVQQTAIQDPYEFQLCSGRYTIETDYNEFYIVYAGTTQDMCNNLCENLQGC